MSTILVVAAHPDDEVLGCGGALAKWNSLGHSVHVLLMTDGEGSRDSTSTESVLERSVAAKTANEILRVASLQMMDFPDNRLDSVDLLEIVKVIEVRIRDLRPFTIITHHSGDVNIDHRIVHDAVIAASRPQPGCPVHELLFFETPSSTEWRPPTSAEQFSPNYFVDITDTLELKLAALNAYKLELRDFPHPRSIRAIESLANWRGATIGLVAAEAFVLGRSIIR